jgi:putative oxidoreductase
MKTALIVYWAARLAAALILVQTLYFKFSAAEESVYIFETVGMEPWGRIAVGILELIAGALLLINATAWIGAGLALGLMGGAIMMHLTMLGISIRGDGGYLFFLAVIVAICSLFVLYTNKEYIRQLIRTMTGY